MSQAQIFNAVCVRDPITGELKAFENKAEADMYVRRPLITAALTALGAAADLVTWLIDNSDTVQNAFSNDTIKRVTKAEKAKLKEGLDTIKLLDDKRLSFLADHADAILTSFKWPTVKKMSDEESLLATRNTLMAELNNEDVVGWIIAHKADVLKAFEEGVIKREVAPQATQGLNTYKLFAALKKSLPETFSDEDSLREAVNTLIATPTAEHLFNVETGEPKHDFTTYLEGAIDKLKAHFLPVAEIEAAE
jgi:hypothetical protein